MELLEEKAKSTITEDNLPEVLADFKNKFISLKREYAKKQLINTVYKSIKMEPTTTDFKGGPGRMVPVAITEIEFNELPEETT